MPIICERCCTDAASAEAETVMDVDGKKNGYNSRLRILVVILGVEEDGRRHSIYIVLAKAVR